MKRSLSVLFVLLAQVAIAGLQWSPSLPSVLVIGHNYKFHATYVDSFGNRWGVTVGPENGVACGVYGIGNEIWQVYGGAEKVLRLFWSSYGASGTIKIPIGHESEPVIITSVEIDGPQVVYRNSEVKYTPYGRAYGSRYAIGQCDWTCSATGEGVRFEGGSGSAILRAGEVTERQSAEISFKYDNKHGSLLTATLPVVILPQLGMCEPPQIKRESFDFWGEEFEAMVSITSTNEVDEILYTIDGTDPHVNGRHYDGPFMVHGDTDVRAFAKKFDYVDSPVASNLISAINAGTLHFLDDANSMIISWPPMAGAEYYNCYDAHGHVSITGTTWIPDSIPRGYFQSYCVCGRSETQELSKYAHEHRHQPFTVSQTVIDVPNFETTIVTRVSCQDVRFAIEPESAAEWINLTFVDDWSGRLKIHLTKNDTSENREAEIYIKPHGIVCKDGAVELAKTAVISVKQRDPLTLQALTNVRATETSTDVYVGEFSSTDRVHLRWDPVVLDEPSSEHPIYRIFRVIDSSEEELVAWTYDLEHNDFNAPIGLSRYRIEAACGDKKSESVFVEGWRAEDIELSPRTIRFLKEGGSSNACVKCTGQWWISSDSDWLSVSQATGRNPADIAIQAQPSGVRYLREGVLNLFYTTDHGVVDMRWPISQCGLIRELETLTAIGNDEVEVGSRIGIGLRAEFKDGVVMEVAPSSVSIDDGREFARAWLSATGVSAATVEGLACGEAVVSIAYDDDETMRHWVDKVINVVPKQPGPLSKALDLTVEDEMHFKSLTGTGDAEKKWRIQSDVWKAGGSAMGSGACSVGKSQRLDLNNPIACKLSFGWRLDKSHSAGSYGVYCDDVLVVSYGGNGDWERVTIDVPDGVQCVSWIYQAGTDSPDNAACLDGLAIEPVNLPLVVKNLVASQGGLVREVVLVWDDVPEADTYFVYRAIIDTTAFVEIAEVNTSEYHDVNVDPAAKYEYKVVASNIAGKGPESEAVVGFCEPEPKTLSIIGSGTATPVSKDKLECMLKLTDDSTGTVTPDWSIVQGADFAQIDANGHIVFLPSRRSCAVTVKATYSANGVTLTASKTITVEPSVADVLGCHDLSLDSLSTPEWFISSDMTFEGDNVLQSGKVSSGMLSALSTTVSNVNEISFWWNVSSEGGASAYLSFTLDGQTRQTIGGTTKDNRGRIQPLGWQQFRCMVDSNTVHKLMWSYVKNSTKTVGKDCGWLANLQLNLKPGAEDEVISCRIEGSGVVNPGVQTQYKCIVELGDGRNVEVENVTWNMEELSGYGSRFDSTTRTLYSGKLYGVVRLHVAGQLNGSEFSADKEVEIIGYSVSSIQIQGDSMVDGGCSLQLTCKVTMNNKEVIAVPATWRISDGSSLATIDSTGLLVAGNTSGDVSIEATFKHLSRTYTATTVVTVKATPPAPPPIQLTKLFIVGGEVVEALTQTQYVAYAVYSDNTTNKVSAAWLLSKGAAVATIDASTGVLTAGASAGSVVVKAAYTDGDMTREATLAVAVVEPPPQIVLIDLYIVGTNRVDTSSQAQYQAYAVYSDSTTNKVSAVWSLSKGLAVAAIDATTGVLTAGANAGSVEVKAVFTDESVACEATLAVTVVEPPPQIALADLYIVGTNQVDTLSEVQYAAYAVYSDNTTNKVEVVWSIVEGIELADMDAATGVLKAGSCTGLLTIRGVYIEEGVLKDTTVALKIVNPHTPTEMVSLVIRGPETMETKTRAQFKAYAVFSDNTSREVDVKWGSSDASKIIGVDAGTCDVEAGDESCIFHLWAWFSQDGVYETAVLTVKVPAPTLIDCVIVGPSEIEKNSAIKYSLLVAYSNGSTNFEEAAWSIVKGKDVASIDPVTGTLTTGGREGYIVIRAEFSGRVVLKPLGKPDEEGCEAQISLGDNEWVKCATLCEAISLIDNGAKIELLRDINIDYVLAITNKSFCFDGRGHALVSMTNLVFDCVENVDRDGNKLSCAFQNLQITNLSSSLRSQIRCQGGYDLIISNCTLTSEAPGGCNVDVGTYSKNLKGVRIFISESYLSNSNKCLNTTEARSIECLVEDSELTSCQTIFSSVGMNELTNLFFHAKKAYFKVSGANKAGPMFYNWNKGAFIFDDCEIISFANQQGIVRRLFWTHAIDHQVKICGRETRIAMSDGESYFYLKNNETSGVEITGGKYTVDPSVFVPQDCWVKSVESRIGEFCYRYAVYSNDAPMETYSSPTPVAYSWLDNYPTLMTEVGGDYEAAANAKTGKIGANNEPMYVWQDYVAGTDPTNLNSVFKALIEIKDGKPTISWEPKLTAEEAAKRIYTTFGKKTLFDSQWKPIDTQPSSDYHFFKVDVKMK